VYSRSRLPRDGVALSDQAVVQAVPTPTRGLKYAVVSGGWRRTADKGTALTSALHDDVRTFLIAIFTFANFPTATLHAAATMKISNSAVPVYTISGSEARPLPEWLIRQRKRCANADTTCKHTI
jgi:hypothetical protein